MSSSYTRLYVHTVWSTKLRARWITPAVAPRLNGFLSARCRAIDCVALAVGGVADHVHALVGFHSTVAVATLARELKATSSLFLKHALGRPEFAWQRGFGAFTVRDIDVPIVTRYIIDQPAHHARGTVDPAWEDAPLVDDSLDGLPARDA